MIKAKFTGPEYKCDEFHVQNGDFVFMTEEKFEQLKQSNSGEFELIETIDKELPPVKKIGE
jgi:hypothetical protein